jgi:hypothetical protein
MLGELRVSKDVHLVSGSGDLLFQTKLPEIASCQWLGACSQGWVICPGRGDLSRGG